MGGISGKQSELKLWKMAVKNISALLFPAQFSSFEKEEEIFISILFLYAHPYHVVEIKFQSFLLLSWLESLNTLAWVELLRRKERISCWQFTRCHHTVQSFQFMKLLLGPWMHKKVKQLARGHAVKNVPCQNLASLHTLKPISKTRHHSLAEARLFSTGCLFLTNPMQHI